MIRPLAREKVTTRAVAFIMMANIRTENVMVRGHCTMKTAVFNIKATSKMVTLPNLYGQYKSKI